MKNLLISFAVIFGPILGTALLFLRTLRAELRNMGGKR